MKTKRQFVFLHGFMGQNIDWNNIKSSLEKLGDHVDCLNLFGHQASLGPKLSFKNFAINLNSSYQKRKFDENILVGYSMGGRLALHCMRYDRAGFWTKIVAISSHHGLKTKAERKARIDLDYKWSKKVQNSSWRKFTSQWNSQQVLTGQNRPYRNEVDFDKSKLALAMLNWSLGVQEDLTSDILQNCHRLAWVVGESDEKFLGLAEKLKLKAPKLKLDRVPGSSHRVIFEKPQRIFSILAPHHLP